MLSALSWPILERIPVVGDVAVSPHGIGIAVGFLLGGWIMTRRARATGIGRTVDDLGDAISRLLTWVGVGAILGARGFYVLNHLDAYTADPLSALMIWQGGLTLLGGIAGGTFAGLLLVRREGWRTALLLDAAAPGLAAGIAVGRFGDLAIGDHIGAPAPEFPLAWQCTGNLWQQATNTLGRSAPLPYPSTGAPVEGCYDVPVIQTALFDVLAATATLVVVLAVGRWVARRRPGALAAAFVASYGTGRLVLDVFREDARYGGLTGSQWTSLTAVVVAVGWLVWAARRREHGPPSDDDAQDQPRKPANVG